MRECLIECGTARASAPGSLAMNVSSPGKNVNMRMDYISRSMVRNIPDLLIDLLEIAAYVYCADQRVSRGSEMLTDFGAGWRRNLIFSIPVRRPEVWQSGEVQDALVGTLGFLSDDSYEFRFRLAKTPVQPRELYFSELLEAFEENDEVALFSGGADSFAGAVNDLFAEGKSMTLVGHYAAPNIRNIQENLVQVLKQRGRMSYVPVWISNEGTRSVEFTQRTRSFLFACLGLVVAQMSGRNSFTLYENGVVSINPPLAGDVVGARATRTTHPKVLRGLEVLFSVLTDHQIEIRTPLQWLTKTEVMRMIDNAGMADQLAATVSCTRTRLWTKRQKHCGLCSQCVDRRFAVLAAGLGQFEPSQNYMRDLLFGDRSVDDELRSVLSYVAFFRNVAAMPNERFLASLPEVASALGYFPGFSAEEAGERVFDLFRRHARSVEEVITKAVKENADRLYRGEVPAASLLATCFSRDRVEDAPPSDYQDQVIAFIDRLRTPILEFAIDDSAGRVLFHGGHHLDGASYRLVAALIANFRAAKRMKDGSDVPTLSSTKLAKAMGLDEQAMRQQLRRLRIALGPLAVTLGIPLRRDSFIETVDGAGYRLNPACREISVGDIGDTESAPTGA